MNENSIYKFMIIDQFNAAREIFLNGFNPVYGNMNPAYLLQKKHFVEDDEWGKILLSHDADFKKILKINARSKNKNLNESCNRGQGLSTILPQKDFGNITNGLSYFFAANYVFHVVHAKIAALPDYQENEEKLKALDKQLGELQNKKKKEMEKSMMKRDRRMMEKMMMRDPEIKALQTQIDEITIAQREKIRELIENEEQFVATMMSEVDFEQELREFQKMVPTFEDLTADLRKYIAESPRNEEEYKKKMREEKLIPLLKKYVPHTPLNVNDEGNQTKKDQFGNPASLANLSMKSIQKAMPTFQQWEEQTYLPTYERKIEEIMLRIHKIKDQIVNRDPFAGREEEMEVEKPELPDISRLKLHKMKNFGEPDSKRPRMK